MREISDTIATTSARAVMAMASMTTKKEAFRRTCSPCMISAEAIRMPCGSRAAEAQHIAPFGMQANVAQHIWHVRPEGQPVVRQSPASLMHTGMEPPLMPFISQW